MDWFCLRRKELNAKESDLAAAANQSCKMLQISRGYQNGGKIWFLRFAQCNLFFGILKQSCSYLMSKLDSSAAMYLDKLASHIYM